MKMASKRIETAREVKLKMNAEDEFLRLFLNGLEDETDLPDSNGPFDPRLSFSIQPPTLPNAVHYVHSPDSGWVRSQPGSRSLTNSMSGAPQLEENPLEEATARIRSHLQQSLYEMKSPSSPRAARPEFLLRDDPNFEGQPTRIRRVLRQILESPIATLDLGSSSGGSQDVMTQVLQRSLYENGQLHRDPDQELDLPEMSWVTPKIENSTVGEQGDRLEESKTCAICFEEFRDRELTILLPKCTHLFHSLCIREWARYKNQCPLCRETLPVRSIPTEVRSDQKP